MEQPDKRDVDLRQVGVREDGDLLEVVRVGPLPDTDVLQGALGQGRDTRPGGSGQEIGVPAVPDPDPGQELDSLVGPAPGSLAVPVDPTDEAGTRPWRDAHPFPTPTAALVAGGALVVLLALLAYLYHLPVVEGDGGARTGPLGAPTAVTAVPLDAGGIAVRWARVPRAEQYVVQQWRPAAPGRAPASGGGSAARLTDSLVAQSAPTSHTRVVLDVAPGRRACFTVHALWRSGGTTQLGQVSAPVCATSSSARAGRRAA